MITKLTGKESQACTVPDNTNHVKILIYQGYLSKTTKTSQVLIIVFPVLKLVLNFLNIWNSLRKTDQSDQVQNQRPALCSQTSLIFHSPSLESIFKEMHNLSPLFFKVKVLFLNQINLQKYKRTVAKSTKLKQKNYGTVYTFRTWILIQKPSFRTPKQYGGLFSEFFVKNILGTLRE